MHALDWKKKPLEVLKRIKTMLSMLYDAMSISWGKLTIPFCKTLFSCINYFQLLTLVTKQVTEE